jgi:large subunit ribosomal protein L32
MAKCDHCGQPKQPHRVCSKCGFYAGREIHEPIAD